MSESGCSCSVFVVTQTQACGARFPFVTRSLLETLLVSIELVDLLQFLDGGVTFSSIGTLTNDDYVVCVDPQSGSMRSIDGELSHGASVPIKIGVLLPSEWVI